MRRQDKLKNIQEANKRILETHVHTDEDKIKYIKSALSNLNSSDLDKIYSSVEKCDPNYESKSINEGTIEISQAQMDMLHKDGKCECGEHTLIYKK